VPWRPEEPAARLFDELAALQRVERFLAQVSQHLPSDSSRDIHADLGSPEAFFLEDEEEPVADDHYTDDHYLAGLPLEPPNNDDEAPVEGELSAPGGSGRDVQPSGPSKFQEAHGLDSGVVEAKTARLINRVFDPRGGGAEQLSTVTVSSWRAAAGRSQGWPCR